MSGQFFMLQELVMDHLEENEEGGYVFTDFGVIALSRALPKGLARDNARAELEAVLGLALALEEDFDAPEAAERVFKTVRAEPLAQEQVTRARNDSDPIWAGEAFQRFTDEESGLVAPVHDRAAPQGYFPIHRLPEFTEACHAVGSLTSIGFER